MEELTSFQDGNTDPIVLPDAISFNDFTETYCLIIFDFEKNGFVSLLVTLMLAPLSTSVPSGGGSGRTWTMLLFMITQMHMWQAMWEMDGRLNSLVAVGSHEGSGIL